MSRSRIEALLAESGLDPASDSADLGELVGVLATLTEPARRPEPSAELAALFAGAEPTGRATPLFGSRRGAVASALVLALSGVGATGLSAAANTLPRPIQHGVSTFSHHYLPFDLPEPPPARHAQLPLGATLPQGSSLLAGRADDDTSRSMPPRPGEPAAAQQAPRPPSDPSAAPAPTSSAQPSLQPSLEPSTTSSPRPEPTPSSSAEWSPSPSAGPSGSPGGKPGHGPGGQPGKPGHGGPGSGSGQQQPSPSPGQGAGQPPGQGSGDGSGQDPTQAPDPGPGQDPGAGGGSGDGQPTDPTPDPPTPTIPLPSPLPGIDLPDINVIGN
jgi:hypothetical protein